MKVLSIKKYNDMQTKKWRANYDKACTEGVDFYCRPQLVFYVFAKNYGYVASGSGINLWAKSKKEAIKRYKEYEEQIKVRGY